LNSRRKRKYIPTTIPGHGLPVRANLLNREFPAEQGGRKRVSDITYPRTIGGRVFLTVVLDLFDRKVIGWAFSADLETVHTTIPALEMACGNRPTQEGPPFHSDRGARYRVKSFRDRLGELSPSIRQSMR
jgi:transposase InsO family protein